MALISGKVAEWIMAAVLKTVGSLRKEPVGSNPTFSFLDIIEEKWLSG